MTTALRPARPRAVFPATQPSGANTDKGSA